MTSVKNLYTDCPFPNRQDRDFREKSLTRIEDLLKVVKPFDFTNARVIELGCGTGELIEAIKKRYPDCYMVGVDFSPSSIEISKKNTPPSDTMIYENSDIANKDSYLSSWWDTFDLVICSGVYHHVSVTSRNELLFCANKLLKKDGLAFFWLYGIGRWRLNMARKALRTIIPENKDIDYTKQIIRNFVEFQNKSMGDDLIKRDLNALLKNESTMIHLFLDPIADCMSFREVSSDINGLFEVLYSPQLDDVKIEDILSEDSTDLVKSLSSMERRAFIDYATIPLFVEYIFSRV